MESEIHQTKLKTFRQQTSFPETQADKIKAQDKIKKKLLRNLPEILNFAQLICRFMSQVYSLNRQQYFTRKCTKTHKAKLFSRN